jgi:hypothetical protein
MNITMIEEPKTILLDTILVFIRVQCDSWHSNFPMTFHFQNFVLIPFVMIRE